MTLLTVIEIKKKGISNIKECPGECPGLSTSLHGDPCVECGGYGWYDHSYGYNHNTEEEYEITGVDVKVQCDCDGGIGCKTCEGSGEYVHTFTMS